MGTGSAGRGLDSAFRQRVYEIVRLVPHGQVTTYGYVALLCGMPRRARHVGWALHSLPPDLVWGAEEDARHLARPPLGHLGAAQSREEASQENEGDAGGQGSQRPAPVPWHRVINAQGRVSTHPDEYGTRRQIELLREEGIAVTDEGELTRGLAAHRWLPDPPTVDDLELPPEVLFRLGQDD